MARNLLSLSELGEKVCWRLVQQAMGMKDAKGLSDFMTGRVAVLLFARPSLPERLCATAAVRQMGGSTIYQGMDGGHWREDARSFQSHLFPVLGYFLDCLYIYGTATSRPDNLEDGIEFPIINAGCADGHPIHALADIACMLKVARSLNGIKACWIGEDNGTLYSLLEGMQWFPFSITLSLPDYVDRRRIEERICGDSSRVRIEESPEKAVLGADFVFAGRKPEEDAAKKWSITSSLMALASPDARLLLSATPIRAIPIEPDVFEGKRSMLVRQSQYRLCVHKRILHWVFGDD